MELSRRRRVCRGRCHSKGAEHDRFSADQHPVTFLVIILVLYLINLLPIDGRAKQIVRIIVIVIGVLSLLKYIAVF